MKDIFNIGSYMKKPNKTVEPKHQAFGVPLSSIGGGDITKPFIRAVSYGTERYVDFGIDNLFPSIIDQMYYQSPLHSSIIDFQVNTAIGGGYDLQSGEGVSEVINTKAFEKVFRLPRLVRSIAMDLKMHKRVHILLTLNEGNVIAAKRMLPSSIRYNSDKTKFYHNNDWSHSRDYTIYTPYTADSQNGKFMYSYIDLESSPGQDIYPLDKTVSVYNWCYLDGESSVLQKKNIERSIFGNLVIKRPNNFNSDKEFADFKRGVENKEGEIVPVLLLTADGRDNLPEVESFPVNQIDKAFENMDRRIDDKICQAHTINPAIMGIQRPGGLSGGSDIREAYPIWEGNVVVPFRIDIDEVVEELLAIYKSKATFKLNEYQSLSVMEEQTQTFKITENE